MYFSSTKKLYLSTCWNFAWLKCWNPTEITTMKRGRFTNHTSMWLRFIEEYIDMNRLHPASKLRVIVHSLSAKALQASQHRGSHSSNQIGFFDHSDAPWSNQWWQMLGCPIQKTILICFPPEATGSYRKLWQCTQVWLHGESLDKAWNGSKATFTIHLIGLLKAVSQVNS